MSWQAKKQTKKGEMTNHKNYEPKETIQDILALPIANPKERGLRKETCEKYGVRMSVSTEDGTTPTAYYFPYYDQQDKLVGYKKRDITLDKMDDRHFTVIGKVSIGCQVT